jgi:Leucine zipper with capping helix domain
LQLEHEATLRDIIVLKEQTVLASAKLADAKRGREDEGGDRVAKLARLAELAKEHAALQTEYEALKENDPQALADLQKELDLVKNAANRWTDNVFNCKTYLVKKRGMDKKEAIKILGITPAFDCKWTILICIAFSLQDHLIQIDRADRPRGQDSEVEYEGGA